MLVSSPPENGALLEAGRGGDGVRGRKGKEERKDSNLWYLGC